MAVPDGALICDNCNHILDTSFLGDDFTDGDEPTAAGEEGATQIKRASDVEADATRIKAAAKIEKPAPRPAARARAAPEEIPEPKAYVPPPPPRKQKLDEVAAIPDDTGEALADLAATFKRLAPTERYGVGGGAAVLATLALPWTSDRHADDVIGLVGGGLWIGLLAAVVIAIAWFRKHPALAPHRERLLQLSTSAALVALLGCFYFVRTAWEIKRERALGRIEEIPQQWPTIGAYLAIIAAGVMTYGAVRTYFARSNLSD